MAKKRKTRKQKILADKRPQQHSVKEAQSTAPSSTPEPITHRSHYTLSDLALSKKETKKVVATAIYDYLRKDLRKTALLTGSIIIAELLLKLVIK